MPLVPALESDMDMENHKKVIALFDSAEVNAPILVDSMEMTGTDGLVVGEVFTVIDVRGAPETYQVLAEERDDWGRFLKIEKVTA